MNKGKARAIMEEVADPNLRLLILKTLASFQMNRAHTHIDDSDPILFAGGATPDEKVVAQFVRRLQTPGLQPPILMVEIFSLHRQHFNYVHNLDGANIVEALRRCGIKPVIVLENHWRCEPKEFCHTVRDGRLAIIYKPTWQIARTLPIESLPTIVKLGVKPSGAR